MYTKNMDQKLRNVTLSIFREIFMLKTFTLNLLMFITETKIFQKLLGSFFSSTISGREYKIGYVTDTGKICNKIIKNLINSNILVIESNYNRKMLNSSFRAYENKKWVSGNWGI
jgi:ribonuclease BN (tRNA processing enzyme)